MASKRDTKIGKVCFGPRDDRFELGQCLDTGAQAEVFFCTRRRTGVTHAAKKVDLGTVERRRNANKVRTNLMREIRITRELHHPHIVNLIEAFWEGEVCFIVMDLAKGGTLHDKLHPGKGLGDEPATQHITIDVLAGIGYMHSHGVIHRDLKPANILITSYEPTQKNFFDVKIADFGLSRVLNEPGGDAAGMTKVGTPAFAAPEILTSTTYGTKADFWSLGCIIFTMLCGEYPFDELPDHIKHPKNAIIKILPCSGWKAATPESKSLVEGLLTKDPDERLDLNGCLQHDWLKAAASAVQSQPSRRQSKSASSYADAQGSDTRSASEEPPIEQGRFVAWLVKMGLKKEPAPVPTGRKPSTYGPTLVPIVGVIQSIRGWSGSAVDSVEISYSSGKSNRHGGEGGTEHKDWALHADEAIVAVTQERIGDGYLGNAVVFFTTRGRTISIKGTDAAAKHRFVAPLGCEISGLQFEENRLIGILLTKMNGSGSVASIWGSEGYAVDGIKFALRDGQEYCYGDEDGGDLQRTIELSPSEYIIIAEQGYKDAFLGYSLSFYTSKGNVYTFRGISATTSVRFMATGDRQICGLAFKEGRLSEVKTCPLNGDMARSDTQTLKNDTHYDAEGKQMAMGPADSSEVKSEASALIKTETSAQNIKTPE